MDFKTRIRQALLQRNKKHEGTEGLTKAAVLVPLYQHSISGEYYIVFTKRTEFLEKHKGQISFPGGACHEEDKGPLDAALRESWEEIGLRPEDVEVLGELDEMKTPTTFYHISPFVGMIPHPYEFQINRDEVEELIEAPLSALRDPQIYWEEQRVYAGKTWPVSHFRYGDRVIWGATAKMLKDLLGMIYDDDLSVGKDTSQ